MSIFKTIQKSVKKSIETIGGEGGEKALIGPLLLRSVRLKKN